MKDIDDMRIGESFYLKMTVAVISTRNGKPCEFDKERIDINDLIIAELEKIKTKMLGQKMFYTPDIDIIDNHIKELKGENNVLQHRG